MEEKVMNHIEQTKVMINKWLDNHKMDNTFEMVSNFEDIYKRKKELEYLECMDSFDVVMNMVEQFKFRLTKNIPSSSSSIVSNACEFFDRQVMIKIINDIDLFSI